MSRGVKQLLLFLVLFAGPVAHAQPTPNASAPEPVSDAERIARLKTAIEADEAKLAEVQADTDLNNPQNAFVQAERDFKDLDGRLEKLKEEIAKLRSEGKVAEAEAKEQAQSDLSARRQLARERFDLALEARKTKLAQVNNLQEKIRQQRAALDRLIGGTPATTPPATQPTSAAAPPPETTKPKTEAEPAAPASQPEAAPATVTPPAAAPATTPPAEKPEKPKSEALKQAEEIAEEKERKATEAKVEVESLSERINTIEKSIDFAKKELKQARQSADNAAATAAQLEDEIERKRADAKPEEMATLRSQLGDARRLRQKAQNDARSKANQLSELQEERSRLQAEQIVALQEEEKARGAAEEAKREVEWLRNPWSPRNALQWLIDHGPKILLIVAAMVLLLWLSRVAEGRLITLLTVQSGGRGTYDERKQRAETVVSAFRHTAQMVIVVGSAALVLQEVGVAVTALLGGAAVAGLAVAFGAQNLIRDYFTGFMILLENQYGLNDVVTICGVSGLVERITLRTTVLRALDGTVHIIPNGQITTVSNLTHGWSRALFNIGVAYKEDADHVMDVLMDVGKDLRDDPDFSALILEDPQMLGVDAFGESEVVIKFYMKTRPLKQWEVKREMLRRIKKRFDAEGIEIPFPHRTVFHHHEAGMPVFGAPIESGIHSHDDG